MIAYLPVAAGSPGPLDKNIPFGLSFKICLDDVLHELFPGDSLSIPQGAKHRAFNDTMELAQSIEVQTGTYFGEDDIVRIEDDYGRLELDHLKDHVTMKEEQKKNKTDWWKKMSNEK